MDTELTLIVGDLVARTKIVRDRFPDLNHTEVAWVADNFDMIATTPVFEYDMGGYLHRVTMYTRNVNLPKSLRSIPKDDPGRVNILYSIDYLPEVIVGVLQRPTLRNLVRMASVMDPDFLSRRRVERINGVLSPKVLD
jgi:hypothetical protein